MSEMDAAVPFTETQLGYVDSFEDVQELMRWLGNRREVLALDTENAGLSPYDSDARVRLLQVGDINSAFTIDAQRWPGLCQDILQKYEGQMTWHNVAYDAKYLQVLWKDLIFPWSRTDDTMIAARLNDNEGSAALKSIGVKLYGKEAAIGQKMLEDGMAKNKWSWNTVPLDFAPYTQYAALDCILGARVWHHFKNVHMGEFREAYELEMQARRICTNMELRGMKVDLDYCVKKSAQLEEYVEQMKKYCEAEYGVKVGSTKSLGEWFKEQGAPLTEFTATGQPKMGEDELSALAANGYELAKLALDARKAAKISGTYLANFQKFADSGGTLHPQINTMAARTHRMSITEPAMQTLPRDDTLVRRAVLPHEGEVLLSADADQIEFRLTAGIFNDTALIDRFNQADSIGPDVFTQIGRDIYGDPDMQKSDPRRATVKTYIYSSLYGAGVKKQAISAGVSFDEMKGISDGFKASYPNLEAGKSRIIGGLESMKRKGQRPYVSLKSGRRLYVNPDRVYTGINYLVQSTAAECLKQALVNLDNAGLGHTLTCPVHDEIIFSLPPDEVADAKPVIEECMTIPEEEFGIVLPAAPGDAMDRWRKE